MKKQLKPQAIATALLLLTCLAFKPSFAQKESWTLEQCITYAFENNIQVQQSELSMEVSRQNVVQSKYNTLPTVNGSATHIYNFGQTIDPFTNQFATSQVRSNQLSLNSSLTLFDGFRTLNTIRRNNADLQASKYDLARMQNDISLNIANQYLQILFNTELLKNAENQLGVTQVQVERIQKLVDAGSMPEGNLREIEAQLASEELQAVNARNQLQLSKLNLAQTLRLENADGFEVVQPNLDNFQGESELSTPGALYLTALDNMPQVKQAEYAYYSAEKSKDLAQGAYSPTLTMTGSIGSGFSENNKEFVDNEFRVKPFNDQLDDNFNKSIGFRLSVPIFNGMNSRTSVQRAKLNADRASLDLENTKLQLRQDIEVAHNDAISALKRYKAAEKSVNALILSFEYTKQRFDVGLLNTFEFNNEKNRLNNAESELLQVKFEYIFKSKVLDFYQGKAISFSN